MPARKRSTHPIEIALTEEQIEGIIAEAASRNRTPGLPAPVASFSAPRGAEAGAGFAPAFAQLAPAGASAVPVNEEVLEVEKHRRNVFRQLRGREPRAR